MDSLYREVVVVRVSFLWCLLWLVLWVWFGEFLVMFLLRTSLFTWEEDGVIAHLPSHYESLLTWFKYNKMVRIIIEGALDSEAQQLTIIHNVRFSLSLPF